MTLGASIGRSLDVTGRQGDPGSTQFYLSLEHDLMRLFGSERIFNVMDRWGAEEGEGHHARARNRSGARRAKSR